MEWQKYNGEFLRLPISDAVEAAIVRESQAGNALKVFIGTDSQVKRRTVEFATVIVFLRQHKGGFMFRVTHLVTYYNIAVTEVFMFHHSGY